MLFSRYVRARKYHKTLSCNFVGVHVSLVHSLTLLIDPGGTNCVKEIWKVCGLMSRMHWTGPSGRTIFDTIPATPDGGKSPRRRISLG